MFNDFITYMEIYAVIIAVCFIIWTVCSFVWYCRELPEKRKTCAELYRIRRGKEHEKA